MPKSTSFTMSAPPRFFQTIVVPRYLHSFPTRRSSDLGISFVAVLLHAPGWPALALSALGYRDRKSTRLNSSHQITSYAVFCLKKKIVVMLVAGIRSTASTRSCANSDADLYRCLASRAT